MAALSSRKPRRPPPKMTIGAAERLATRILQELEPFARDHAQRKQEVAILPKPQLIRRLRGETSHSPFIVSLAWFAAAQRGTTTTPSLGIFNPDPNPYAASDLFRARVLGPRQHPYGPRCAHALGRSSVSPLCGRYRCGAGLPDQLRYALDPPAHRRAGRHVFDELAAVSAQRLRCRHIARARMRLHGAELSIPLLWRST